jgi:hypothetical protein
MSGLLSNVAKFVSGLARDAEAVVALRNKPEQLAAELGLSKTATAALTDVDRFFHTEKPILQAPGQPIRAVKVPSTSPTSPAPTPIIEAERAQSPSPGVRVAQAIPIQAPKVETVAPPAPLTALEQLALRTPLTASADTGSLLPGPNTGTFTASGSVSGSLSGVAPSPGYPAPGPAIPPAPQVGPAPRLPPVAPRPPIPAPRPPFGPVGPATPIPATPMAPPTPVFPWAPPSQQPCEPQIPLAAWAGPRGAACAGACDAAIVAINALVASTAQASLTAIAAIAAQRGCRDGP